MRPVLLALVATALFGCAHTHYDASQDKLCYRAVCYRFGSLGAEWQALQVKSDGAAIGFFNPRLGAIIASNATCRTDAEAAPLASLTRQLLIGYTDRQQRLSESVMLDGRGALHTVVEARLDGVPMVLDLYVLRRDGCVFDLSLAAPPDRYAEGRAEFARFVGGFADARKT